MAFKFQYAPFLILLAISSLHGCGYYYYAGDLKPDGSQGTSMSIADDGTVTFSQDRFEVRLKPMTDDELNRQFPSHSNKGPKSTNPFTFGDTKFWGDTQQKRRFTVFRLSVKNYAYPKVRIDPSKIVLKASNEREYWSLGFDQLDTYYRAYAIGYRGNEYDRYQERRDLLRRTMFENEEIFSGQESDGFVIFEVLHPDVKQIKVEVHDIVTRFDFRNEPIETLDLNYSFVRDIGKEYTDGRRELTN
jgi:hypothetical protein